MKAHDASATPGRGRSASGWRCAGIAALALLAMAAPGSGRSTAATTEQGVPERIAPRLARILEGRELLTRSTDQTMAVWVRFADRDLRGSALERALDAVEQDLSARARERRRRGTPSGERIVNEHDLPVESSAIESVIATGARLRHVSRLLNAASFEVTTGQLSTISGLETVKQVDAVASYVRSAVELDYQNAEKIESKRLAARVAGGALDYGASRPALDQINIPQLHAQDLSGSGVTIAILDTGFELTHESLQHLDVVATHDFVGDDDNVGQEPGDPENSSVHGTEMLGILAGFSQGNLIGSAFAASVILARTEDIGGESRVEEDNWIAALEWADSLGADIICSSVGYYDWYWFDDLDGTSPITVAADLAALRGVNVVVSMGQERNNPQWPHLIAPADGRHVISVGGVDLGGFLVGGSSPGPTADGRTKPDVVALAQENLIPFYLFDDVYIRTQGVDAAVPLVAGLVALVVEQSPNLTPIQIAQALRETASRSLLPDNDYGWGVADALGASQYWLPGIDHEPLQDTEVGTDPFAVRCTLTSRLPVVDGGLALNWRAVGSAWQRADFRVVGPLEYEATIPWQDSGVTIEYYISATNELGLTVFSPALAPTDCHRFTVDRDLSPPVISHRYLDNVASREWPPTVKAWVDDNLGVRSVLLGYSIGSGASQAPIPMEFNGEYYEAEFPFPPGSVPPGVEVRYVVSAQDDAAIPNLSVAGPWQFEVVETRGRVLLITSRPDLTGAPATRAVADPRGALQAMPVLQATTIDIAGWIEDSGFDVDILKDEDVRASSLLGYDLVVYTSGNSLAPLSYSVAEQALVHWVESGGHLIIEGGDLAFYVMSSVDTNPLHAEFRDKVLRIDEFGADTGNDYTIPAARLGHAFVTRPNRLPAAMSLNIPPGVNDPGAADVVFPIEGTEVVLQTSFGSALGGAMVTDNDTGPDAGSLVYLPFDMGQLAESTARELLENALTYLTVHESPGPSSLAGVVSLAGGASPDGVVVRIGDDYSAVVDGAGSFSLNGLWGGDFTVVASREGYGEQMRQVSLTEGEAITDLQFYLMPVVAESRPAVPDQPIPDNDPAGITSSVSFTASGRVARVNVDIDISHFSIGNVQVLLTSPNGTEVILHESSASLDDDLVGNWPRTLVVDDPGGLEAFEGEQINGAWTLSVADLKFGATGKLNFWQLNLVYTENSATATGPAPTVHTRILGNRPNPWNPRTRIEFELGEDSPVIMTVHDVRGRLVREILNERMSAGRRSVIWDGADARGVSVGSGVYFARLTVGGRTMVHKMTLVR